MNQYRLVLLKDTEAGEDVTGRKGFELMCRTYSVSEEDREFLEHSFALTAVTLQESVVTPYTAFTALVSMGLMLSDKGDEGES